jgi:superfamily II DNA or RNA helicase
MPSPSRRHDGPRRTRSAIVIRSGLREPGPLRAWQRDALHAWEAEGRRGIVAAATGTGKTRVALAAVQRFWADGSRVVVVVPSISLQRQWVTGICQAFGLASSQIGQMGGASGHIHEGHGIVVAVINSARNGLRALNAGWRHEGRQTMLVVDECHWAASLHNAAIFDGVYDASLGLSATPERSDDGLDEVLVPHLGPVIFRYGLRAALDDELLAPLTLVNLYFDLSRPELLQLEPLQLSISEAEERVLRSFPDLGSLQGLERVAAISRASVEIPAVRGLRDLYQQRSQLLERSDARRAVLQDLARSGALGQRPTLVFHERIDQAKRTAAELDSLGCRCALELSIDDPQQRQEALRDFRSGLATALVAVRTLDEGIDLPDAKLAIIMSGGYSLRQRIQRIGRVVRPTGARACVVSLLARQTAEQWVVGDNDQFLVGRDRVMSAHSVDEAVGLLPT